MSRKPVTEIATAKIPPRPTQAGSWVLSDGVWVCLEGPHLTQPDAALPVGPAPEQEVKMPFFWRKKVILAKIEASYAANVSMTGAANAMLVKDLKIMPMEGQDIDRGLDLPWFGNDGTIPADLHVKVAFKIELEASGSLGVAPKFGPLLRACGILETIVAVTSVTYSPISPLHESVGFSWNVDGLQQSIKGMRGNVKLGYSAQGIPYYDFEMQGLYAGPTDTSALVPVLTGFIKPQVSSAVNTPVFTVAGTSLVMRSFTMDVGIQLENRFLIGSDAVIIADRAETADMVVEAVPMATFNPYALAESGVTSAVVLTHGTVAGKRTTLNIPALQLLRPTGLENAQNILEWPLKGQPKPVSGNDQWSLVLT